MKSNNILSTSIIIPPTSFAGVMKVVALIKVVSALPVTLEPGVTYLVGAQSTILISGLNGNNQQFYKLVADIINPTTSDNINMRFNGVSANVYDFRFSYAGSTSTTASNAQTSMAVCPTSGSNSINHLSMDIDASTGNNRNFCGIFTQIGSSQQVVAGNGVIGGNWRDNSTNITSITLGYSSISGGFGVGTTIRLFALQNS